MTASLRPMISPTSPRGTSAPLLVPETQLDPEGRLADRAEQVLGAGRRTAVIRRRQRRLQAALGGCTEGVDEVAAEDLHGPPQQGRSSARHRR
jgi:hypothetical protein